MVSKIIDWQLFTFIRTGHTATFTGITQLNGFSLLGCVETHDADPRTDVVLISVGSVPQ